MTLMINIEIVLGWKHLPLQRVWTLKSPSVKA